MSNVYHRSTNDHHVQEYDAETAAQIQDHLRRLKLKESPEPAVKDRPNKISVFWIAVPALASIAISMAWQAKVTTQIFHRQDRGAASWSSTTEDIGNIGKKLDRLSESVHRIESNMAGMEQLIRSQSMAPEVEKLESQIKLTKEATFEVIHDVKDLGKKVTATRKLFAKYTWYALPREATRKRKAADWEDDDEEGNDYLAIGD